MSEPERMSPVFFGAAARSTLEAVESSSGGVATVFARSFIRSGGVVFGAAFDEFPIVRHILVDDECGLERLRGSKYVESDVSAALMEAPKVIKSGRRVLFIGLPCHVAALYGVLGKDYPNLTTVDLLCHGKPPQALFTRWVTELQKVFHKKIVSYSFRNKATQAWNDSGTYEHVCEFEDGHVVTIPMRDNWYARYFCGGISNMEGCYRCPFARERRVGDITLGDFWGIEKDRRFSDRLRSGVSFVSLQSLKGHALFKESVSDLVAYATPPELYGICYDKLTHRWKKPRCREVVLTCLYGPKLLRDICDIVVFGFAMRFAKYL